MMGAMATPTFSSTSISVSPITISRATRTMRVRTGGSKSFFSSQHWSDLPTCMAAIKPTTRMKAAPSSLGP